jgi:hypothetical protein
MWWKCRNFVVPGFFATQAIFFFVLFKDVLKMALIKDDLPELERPTNKNYFYFLNNVLSYSICSDRNLGNVV